MGPGRPAGPTEPPAATPGPGERLDELLFHVEIDTSELDESPRLPEIPLFADLAPEAFQRLIDGARRRVIPPGTRAVQEGERGDSFFVVVRGLLDVVRGKGAGEGVRLAQLRDGAFFGEMALLAGAPRSASVWAVEEAELLEFSGAALRQLVREHPSVAVALRRFYRQRLLANVLATSPLFRPFDRPTRERLIAAFRTREVAAGEEVVVEGQPVEGLFVVLHGSLEVQRKRGDAAQRLGLLREGDVFGEQSLLHGGDAGATCRARTRGMVLRLPREAFEAVLAAHPAVRALLDEIDVDRQRRNERESDMLM